MDDDGDPTTLSIAGETVDCTESLSNPDISFEGCGGGSFNVTPSAVTLDFCTGGTFIRTWTSPSNISNSTVVVSQEVTVVQDTDGPAIDMVVFPADITLQC